MKVSYVLAVHNLKGRIGSSVERLVDHLQPYPGSEIIMVENASTDGTQRMLHKLAGENRGIKVIATHSPKGLGSAYRKGIQVAAGDVIVLEHGDLPFGFTDFDSALALKRRPPLVFASKAHRDSILKPPLVRRLLTRAFTWVRTAIVQLDVGDSQGTVVIDAPLAKSLLPYLFCEDYLITTEIGVLAARNGIAMTEVPVIYPGDSTPFTTISPLADGLKMLLGLMELRSRVQDVHGVFRTFWHRTPARTTFSVPKHKAPAGAENLARVLGTILLTAGILGAARIWSTTAFGASQFTPANFADNWLPGVLVSFLHRALPIETAVFIAAAIGLGWAFAAAFHLTRHLFHSQLTRFFVSVGLVGAGLDLSVWATSFPLLWFAPVLMVVSYGLAVAHEQLAVEPIRVAALVVLAFLCAPVLAPVAVIAMLATLLATTPSVFVAVKRITLLAAGTSISILAGVLLVILSSGH